MKIEITLHGKGFEVTRAYLYDPREDYNIILQDFIDDVEEHSRERNIDHAHDQLIGA